MITIQVASALYLASLSGCYDGDTCKVQFYNFPQLVETQSLRFEGFDTPERYRPKCDDEKTKARQARDITLAYMQGDVRLLASGEFDKYGRLLVRAPDLRARLIEKGLAVKYEGGKRQGWCDATRSRR